MRDRPNIMRLERAQNAEGRGNDMHEAIDGAEEEVRGSGANTRQVGLCDVVSYQRGVDVRVVVWGTYPEQRGAVLW